MGPVPDIDVDAEIRRFKRHRRFEVAAMVLLLAACGLWIAFFGTSIVLLLLWAGGIAGTSLQAMTGVWRSLLGLSLLSLVSCIGFCLRWVLLDRREDASEGVAPDD